MTMTRAFWLRALAISISCRMAAGNSSTGWRTSISRPSWRQAVAGVILLFCLPHKAGPDGRAAKKNIVGHAHRADERQFLVDDGHAQRGGFEAAMRGRAWRPSISMRPSKSVWMPARILMSVLLPAPFSPASTCTSPARHSNWTSRRTVTGPNRLVMPDKRTNGDGLVSSHYWCACNLRKSSFGPRL